MDATPDSLDTSLDMLDMLDMSRDEDVDGSSDQGSDQRADQDAEADEMSCSPVVECPAEACGLIDNGCEGTIDCGTCACVNGQPSEPTCGTCGLMTPSCDNDELLCEEINYLEGFDGNCSQLIYVDASSAGGLEQGTKQEPYATIKQAFDFVNGRPAGSKWIVVLSQVEQTHQGILEIPKNTSLMGGYSTDWVRTENRTVISAGGRLDSSWVPFEQRGDRVGLLVRDNQDVLIDGIEINQVDVGTPLPGSDSIGMLFTRSFGSLNNVYVQAVSGADGADGVDGSKGNDGPDGVDGRLVNIILSRNAPGINNTVIADCPLTRGGNGGEGGESSGEDGDNGEAGVTGAAGGTGGSDQSIPNGKGGIATNGSDGADAILSAPGSGFSSPLLTSTTSYFSVANIDGKQGANGEDGTGGGGGGGGSHRIDLNLAGAGGGSGGYGGCGGEGGQGGQGGGSSIGLLLLNASLVYMTNSSFAASQGGRGGANAAGGAGGTGGDRGRGGRGEVDTYRAFTNSGGYGGLGGDGGQGSRSHPGLGGHSIGIGCVSSPNVTSDEATLMSVTSFSNPSQGGPYRVREANDPTRADGGLNQLAAGCASLVFN